MENYQTANGTALDMGALAFSVGYSKKNDQKINNEAKESQHDLLPSIP